MAGTDGNFIPANAVISGGRVILDCGHLVAVQIRYGAEADMGAVQLDVNLQNSEGLPASPFTFPIMEPWDAWRADHFAPSQLLDPAVSGPIADPDGDGLSNISEFAHGLDPTVSNSLHSAISCAVVFNSPDQLASLELTYRQRVGGTGLPGINYVADGLTYVVETSKDLMTWTSGSSVVGSVAQRGPESGDTEPITLSIIAGAGGQSAQFVRLRLKL